MHQHHMPSTQAIQSTRTSAKASCWVQIAGKLRSKWDGPFVITNVFPNGAVQLQGGHSSSTFQIKPFHEGLEPMPYDTEMISLVEPAPSDDTALADPASH
ncbi:hypothetical protein CR513_42373, partial [Mucuna pruriens]